MFGITARAAGERASAANGPPPYKELKLALGTTVTVIVVPVVPVSEIPFPPVLGTYAGGGTPKPVASSSSSTKSAGLSHCVHLAIMFR